MRRFLADHLLVHQRGLITYSLVCAIEAPEATGTGPGISRRLHAVLDN